MGENTMQCSDCDAELTEEARQPCPECGSSRRTFHPSVIERASTFIEAPIEYPTFVR